MGIWYGASIVSVVETIEIIIDVLKIVFRKKPIQSDEQGGARSECLRPMAFVPY